MIFLYETIAGCRKENSRQYRSGGSKRFFAFFYSVFWFSFWLICSTFFFIAEYCENQIAM